MITFFKHNNPIAIILLLILATIPEWRDGLTIVGEIQNKGIFYTYFNDFVFPLHHHGGGISILNIILLLSESLFLNKIVTDYKLMEKPGIIPAMTFLLVVSLFPFRISTFFVLINALLLILLKLLISIYKQEHPSNNLIAAGFVTGMLASLNSGYWLTYAWLITALFIMRPASAKEWLVTTLGFLMPFYFIFSIQYLSDQSNLKDFFTFQAIIFKIPSYTSITWIKIGCVLLLPIFGIWLYNGTIGKMVIQNRKTYLILLFLFMLFLGILSLKLGGIANELFIILVPGVILIAPIFLSFKKDFIPNLIFFLLIALALMR